MFCKEYRGIARLSMKKCLTPRKNCNANAEKLVGAAATPLRVRERSAEVDPVFEGACFVFSLWHIQRKKTARVSLDEVANEGGLIHFLKSDVIVIVSTREIGACRTNQRSARLATATGSKMDSALLTIGHTLITGKLGAEGRIATITGLSSAVSVPDSALWTSQAPEIPSTPVSFMRGFRAKPSCLK